MYSLLEISASGMKVQRRRMETIANNLANADTLFDRLDKDGKVVPFRRKMLIAKPAEERPGVQGFGAQVAGVYHDPTPFRKVHMPGHPFADEDGMVLRPNVDEMTEMVNMMMASRAYEANITAANATKSLMQGIGRILA